MANQYFKFKQFTIQQSHAAMKVGTDGVLLGAWTDIPQNGTALDVGTGTGLIALMLSQRNPKLKITAIEIDKAAAKEASNNIKNSPWNEQINIVHNSLQEFTSHFTLPYTLIVCNPPFFNNSKPSPNTLRNTARQTSQITVKELFNCVQKLLTANGLFSIILPYDLLNATQEIASTHNLFAKKITIIKPTPEKVPHRFMALFGHNKYEPTVDELIIESNGRHQYSDAYKKLTTNFYLDEEQKKQLLNIACKAK